MTAHKGIHEVAIVLDPNFGDRLSDLSARMHVWIIHAPGNRTAIQHARAAHPTFSFDRGVTSMNSAGKSPEEQLPGTLDAVDLHHGWHSHSPPWTVLHCFGLAATNAVRDALAEYGVDRIREGAGCFVAVRPVPPLPE